MTLPCWRLSLARSCLHHHVFTKYSRKLHWTLVPLDICPTTQQTKPLTNDTAVDYNTQRNRNFTWTSSQCRNISKNAEELKTYCLVTSCSSPTRCQADWRSVSLSETSTLAASWMTAATRALITSSHRSTVNHSSSGLLRSTTSATDRCLSQPHTHTMQCTDSTFTRFHS